MLGAGYGPQGYLPPSPAWIAGNYTSTYDGPIASTTAVNAADVKYMYPFAVARPIAVNGASARVQTGGAGSAMKLALYGASLVDNRPVGSPLVSDTTGAATTGNNTAPLFPNITGITLYPGLLYWWASKFTGTLPIMWSIAAGGPQLMRLAGSTDPLGLNVNGLSIAEAYANAFGSIAQGASFTSFSVGGIPIITMKS